MIGGILQVGEQLDVKCSKAWSKSIVTCSSEQLDVKCSKTWSKSVVTCFRKQGSYNNFAPSP